MKIVFSDLDGTLLASDKTIAPRTARVLERLAEEDIEFVPCSGRPFSGIKSELIELAATHYIVCSNGALICRVTGDNECEVIHRTEMPKESVLWLYEQVGHMDILFDVLADGKSYSELARFKKLDEYVDDANMLRDMRSMRTPYDATVPELLPSLEHIERVTIYWKNQEDCARIIEAVESRPEINWVRSFKNNLEISSAAASKGAALEWLCATLDIPVSESVAFGDGNNDLSMLTIAGDGVAMANAEEEVLAKAPHSTDTNDNCGVAQYLEHLLELA